MKMKKGILRVALAGAIVACLCIAPLPTASASYRSGFVSFTLEALGAESYHFVYASEDAAGTEVIVYVSLSAEWWLAPIAMAHTQASESSSQWVQGFVGAGVQVGFGGEAWDYDNHWTNQYYSHVWLHGTLRTYDWFGNPLIMPVWKAALVY